MTCRLTHSSLQLGIYEGGKSDGRVPMHLLQGLLGSTLAVQLEAKSRPPSVIPTHPEAREQQRPSPRDRDSVAATSAGVVPGAGAGSARAGLATGRGAHAAVPSEGRSGTEEGELSSQGATGSRSVRQR